MRQIHDYWHSLVTSYRINIICTFKWSRQAHLYIVYSQRNEMSQIGYVECLLRYHLFNRKLQVCRLVEYWEKPIFESFQLMSTRFRSSNEQIYWLSHWARKPLNSDPSIEHYGQQGFPTWWAMDPEELRKFLKKIHRKFTAKIFTLIIIIDKTFNWLFLTRSFIIFLFCNVRFS